MWLSIWSRAVILPASRRAAGLWAGAAIVGGILFGPTALRPHDVTDIAFGEPVAGAALALTWLLLFLPVARVIVRADAARYLRSLPHGRVAPIALAVAALVGLQLPWLVLWALGAGARGVAIVAGETAIIALLAAWRMRPSRRPAPKRLALSAIYTRALRRRAVDAIVRAAGLAIVAGGMAALLVRNNDVGGADAGTFGGSAIAIFLVPAQLGVLVALGEAHRASAWLAASTGASETSRALALFVAIVGFDVAFAALSTIVAAVIVPHDAPWIALAALCAALTAALAATRAVQVHAGSPTLAMRVVTAATVAAAITILGFGLLGLIGGVVAIASVGVLATRGSARLES